MKLKTLKLALSVAPDADVRYYLNGVFVTPTAVTSSDGARLAHITEATEGLESPVIIPKEAVKSFLVKAKKCYPGMEVTIIKEDSGVFICLGDIREYFTPIDSRYPEFNKVLEQLNIETEIPVFHQYNWEFLAESAKAMTLYGKHKKGVVPILRTTATYGFFKDEDAVIMIMPLKS